jgi:hypothetical protein
MMAVPKAQVGDNVMDLWSRKTCSFGGHVSVVLGSWVDQMRHLHERRQFPKPLRAETSAFELTSRERLL